MGFAYHLSEFAGLPVVEIDWSFPNPIFDAGTDYRYVAVSE